MEIRGLHFCTLADSISLIKTNYTIVKIVGHFVTEWRPKQSTHFSHINGYRRSSLQHFKNSNEMLGLLCMVAKAKTKVLNTLKPKVISLFFEVLQQSVSSHILRKYMLKFWAEIRYRSAQKQISNCIFSLFIFM